MLCFVWPKMIVVKMWVPKYGPIAQCFKHIGTFIPMYIIIQHYIHKLEKNDILKIIGSEFMYKLPKYPWLKLRVITVLVNKNLF